MLTAITSGKAAPGVTTSVWALALTWPRPVLVADGDPAGGDMGAFAANVPGALADWVTEGIKLAGVGMDWLPVMITRAMIESSGNPNAEQQVVVAYMRNLEELDQLLVAAVDVPDDDCPLHGEGLPHRRLDAGPGHGPPARNRKPDECRAKGHRRGPWTPGLTGQSQKAGRWCRRRRRPAALCGQRGQRREAWIAQVSPCSEEENRTK